MEKPVAPNDPVKVHLQVAQVTAWFAQWFERHVAPLSVRTYPTQLAQWRKQLTEIQATLQAPAEVRIALVGTTGAGKSTFLNAVLGQEVLPVGVMAPCTAFVTAVRYAPGSEYKVQVLFVTPEEWRKDLDAIVAALEPDETNEEGTDKVESKRFRDAARKRIAAVYRLASDDGFDPEALRATPLPAEVQAIFDAGSRQSDAFVEPKEMLAYLRKLVRGDSALWPLIKQVELSGPYECLSGGVELVDLPGLNDPNEARVEVTRGFLRNSIFVWVVFSMVRGLTEDIQRVLREERILRSLVLTGSYHALSLVGTKADEIDMNLAEQLGLKEDCELAELVARYRTQTVKQARQQLVQMVRDLTAEHEADETAKRMLDMARRVRVHTTSANGYMKLKGIGRLRKEYPFTDPKETGVPDVHEHLRQIGRDAGVFSNARVGYQRLRQLRDEIAFFFRARAQEVRPGVDEATRRLQGEFDALRTSIKAVQDRANDQLQTHRQQFHRTLESLLARSIQGVSRSTDSWAAIHWATLKATVHRDGCFRSPTTGRSYDFNEDLATPLLDQLPVSWEKYFTDDLGRVVNDYVVHVKSEGKNFCRSVSLVVDLLLHKRDDGMASQLAWFEDKVGFLANGAQERVRNAVRDRRSELAAKMPATAKSMMQRAYDAAKGESGPGVKRRILGHVQPAALTSAKPMYQTIEQDLSDGLQDLELVVTKLFRELTGSATEQAQIVAHNANVCAGETEADPAIAALLKSLEEMPWFKKGS
jgi:hypothetical protein